MDYKKAILTRLVENYRKSKKDTGENRINRRTQIVPEKLYQKYSANDGDFDEISALNQAVEELSDAGFVFSDKEAFGTQIQHIYLQEEKILEAEKYLVEKCGYTSKDMHLETLRRLVEKYKDASAICAKECEKIMKNIAQRKVSGNIGAPEEVLRAVAFLENNERDLYLREASSEIYGSSKYFEENTLQAVCKLLWKYADQKRKEDEKPDEILLRYHIRREPQKLCIKGGAILRIAGKDLDISGLSGGVELRTADLVNIESVTLLTQKFMTIENRTSYLRYAQEDVVLFDLGGYANRYQRDFIKMVYRENPDVHYLHFGDIDAGGFWIHHNLCEITGVGFELFCMSAEELKNKAFAPYLRKLSVEDKKRLQTLKEVDIYAETVEYMLCHNVKLEQEMISLALMEEN